MIRAMNWLRRAAGYAKRAGVSIARSLVAVGLCAALAAPADAAGSWTLSTRAGVTYATHDTYRMGGSVFDASPTLELGAARALGGPFSLLIGGTYVTQREERHGVHALAAWEAVPDYSRTSLLPMSVSLRLQRVAPAPDGLTAGLEVGPALVWWRESKHVRLYTPFGGETHDASYTLDAFVPGVRAAGRVMTPSIVGGLALELGVSWLRTTAVQHPEPGFSSAQRAVDGLSLLSFTAGIALRP